MSVFTEYNAGAYLCAMAAGLLCACAMFFFSARGRLRLSSGRAAALSGGLLLLGPVLGLLGAKLFYFLFRFFIS